jgi:hypothetical protein
VEENLSKPGCARVIAGAQQDELRAATVDGAHHEVIDHPRAHHTGQTWARPATVDERDDLGSQRRPSRADRHEA